MIRRRYREFWPVAGLAAVLSASLTLLAPLRASGQDAMLPLKIAIGSKAPDFALPSSEGKIVRLSSLAGRKVLIDFYRGYW